jgi:hypothetical protein
MLNLSDWDEPPRALPIRTCIDTVMRDHTRCPPCIRGQVIDTKPHDQLVLQYPLPYQLPKVDISSISDQQLLEYLCQNRAMIMSCWLNASTSRSSSPVPVSQEYAGVCRFANEDAPLAVMHIALIRDILMGAARERLQTACSGPCWTVASDEF